MTQVILTIIFLFSVSMTDLKLNKVKNKHLLIFMGVAFISNTLMMGLEGIEIASYGFLMPLIIGYPLFLLGLIPAGDVKLFMALGSMIGIKAIGQLLMITLLLSSIYSILLLIKRKDFSGFFSFYDYLKEIIYTKKITPYDSEKSIRFPLAPVIFISYLLFIFPFNML